MTRHNVSLASLALITSLSACRPANEEAAEFRAGVPTAETVTVSMPGSGGQALTLEAQASQGATAQSYKLTYGVTHVLNGGALFVGGLVRTVIAFPPTSIQGDTAVWGPWTGDLEPVTWRLTVTRVAEHQFHYSFDGQPRGNPTAPFVTVLSGSHTVAVDAKGDPLVGFGSGTFTLSWDNRATLPAPNPRELGTATYTYSRLPGDDTTVNAQFRQVLDDNDKRVDVDYAFTHLAAGGGVMDFVDTAAAQQGMPAGRWTVRSRWMATGAGRSDAQATGGSSNATVTASECWNTSFASTFLVHSWDPSAGYGVEATDCVFTAAEYSKL